LSSTAEIGALLVRLLIVHLDLLLIVGNGVWKRALRTLLINKFGLHDNLVCIQRTSLLC
jgi:hypothetical protein